MKKAFKNTLSDIPASIVVFLVALPLCLGIALGSGAPLFSGIIAGIIGGIVVGSLSGSQLSVSGPAAGLTAIVAVAIIKMPAFEAFLLSVVIAGIIQVVLGYIKAGIFGDYVPASVIKGMLSAIGIILIIKQIPYLIGYIPDTSNLNEEGLWGKMLSYVTPLAIIIGMVSLGIQIFWDEVLLKKYKVFQFIPAPLIVVLVSLVVSQSLIATTSLTLGKSQMVNIPQATDVEGFLSFFSLPAFQYLLLPDVWITGITLAIVASLESLLNIEAADRLDPFHRVTPTNRELKAQGTGNIISGLLGGLPVTSVVVRTSVNINAGAKSKKSAIMHGMLLLLSVAFIPFLLNKISLAALAAILIYTGYKLAKPALFINIWRKGLDQFIPFVVTILVIIFADLLVGIMVGMAVGLFFVMRNSFKSALFTLKDGNKYLFRLRKDVSYLNKPLLKNKLEKVEENSYVIIDVSSADYIDKDVAEVINDFLDHASLKNIRVTIKKNSNPTHQVIRQPHQLEIAV